MQEGPILHDDVLLIRRVHGGAERPRRWEGRLGRERDCHGEELEPLRPVHRGDPHPWNGPVVRAGLEHHRLDAGRAQRRLNPIRIDAARAEDPPSITLAYSASIPYSARMSSRHRKTLAAVFTDPVSGTIEWAAVESLLLATEGRG